MRNIKCRRCKKLTPKNEIYQITHITKNGNEQKRNYCTEECYRLELQDVYMLKQCQYFIDSVLGYVCVNNQKNKSLKELIDAGYTREQVYDCMVEMKQKIEESLSFRSDISNEGHKILYIYTIIKNNIKEITDRNSNKRLISKDDEFVDDISANEIIVNKKRASTSSRRGLLDIIGGKYE